MNAKQKIVEAEMSLHDIARECLDAAGWGDRDGAEELFVERVMRSDDLVADAISRAGKEIFSGLRLQERERANRAIQAGTPNAALERPTMEPREIGPKAKETPRTSTVIDIKPAPKPAHKPQGYLTACAELQRYFIRGVHILEATETTIRDDISARATSRETDAKWIKFDTELLKRMKPGKNVGRSMPHSDVIDLIRKHRL